MTRGMAHAIAASDAGASSGAGASSDAGASYAWALPPGVDPSVAYNWATITATRQALGPGVASPATSATGMLTPTAAVYTAAAPAAARAAETAAARAAAALSSHAASEEAAAAVRRADTNKTWCFGSVGVVATGMQGKRSTMEDAEVACGLGGAIGVALFDGHGGDGVAKDAARMWPSAVRESRGWGEARERGLNGVAAAQALRSALREANLTMDAAMRGAHESSDAGSTAITAIITPDTITVANVGDSRCILVRKDGSVKELSRDHKPTRPDETARILAAGHDVDPAFGGGPARVDGGLAVSRALGDFTYTDAATPPAAQAVTAVPEVDVHLRSEEDLLLILACDGVWDEMSSEEVAWFMHQALPTGDDSARIELVKAADKLINYALMHGSTDNISCLCVLLPRLDRPMLDANDFRWSPLPQAYKDSLLAARDAAEARARPRGTRL